MYQLKSQKDRGSACLQDWAVEPSPKRQKLESPPARLEEVSAESPSPSELLPDTPEDDNSGTATNRVAESSMPHAMRSLRVRSPEKTRRTVCTQCPERPRTQPLLHRVGPSSAAADGLRALARASVVAEKPAPVEQLTGQDDLRLGNEFAVRCNLEQQLDAVFSAQNWAQFVTVRESLHGSCRAPHAVLVGDLARFKGIVRICQEWARKFELVLCSQAH